jgi:hypothetical protein
VFLIREQTVQDEECKLLEANLKDFTNYINILFIT